MEEATKKVLSKLESMCSRREYCSSDIYEKAIKALDGDKDAATEVLESLKADKYVDDFRYASAYAREKASISGWGPVKIRYTLSAKRISREAIDAAFAEIDPDQADSKLEKVLETKWRTLEGDPQAKLKLLKFALSRGYEYESVKDIVEKINRG